MENILDKQSVWQTEVCRIFPEISQIKDSLLRQKTISTLAQGYKEGGWTLENYDDCPVSLRVKSEKMRHQTDHVHAVVKIALSMYEILEKVFGLDTGLHDQILVGALLHDVGKLLEFHENGNGQIDHSVHADLMRHPLSGAILAAENGLPAEIIHIIATHSFEGEKSKKTLASTILKLADEATFSYTLELDARLMKQ